MQKAALGKQGLVYSDQLLDIHSANSTKGFNAISVFTSDNAMADVLKIVYANGIQFIALRSVGYNNVDLIFILKSKIKMLNL